MTQRIQPASLADTGPYRVPKGARLVFHYGVYTTDGFMRGDVHVEQAAGAETQIIARNVAASGDAERVQVLGDWARIFPDPLAVQRDTP